MTTSLWHDTTSGISLLGSIHHLPESYPLPPQIKSTYIDASVLVVEARNTGEWHSALTFLRDGTLMDVLGKDLYDRFVEIAESLGMSRAGIDRYQPFRIGYHLYEKAMARILDSAQSNGLDSKLINCADAEGKRVQELEDINFVHYHINKNPEAGKEYIRQVLDELATLKDQQLAFREAWREGNITRLEELTNDDAYPLVKKITITERNHQWLPELIEIRNSGERALVVVGVGHLIGAGNLRELLEAQGAKFTQA